MYSMNSKNLFKKTMSVLVSKFKQFIAHSYLRKVHHKMELFQYNKKLLKLFGVIEEEERPGSVFLTRIAFILTVFSMLGVAIPSGLYSYNHMDNFNEFSESAFVVCIYVTNLICLFCFVKENKRILSSLAKLEQLVKNSLYSHFGVIKQLENKNTKLKSALFF